MKYFVPLLFLVVFFSGCALSPQTITINPSIEVEKTNVQKETSLYVKVVDKRSSPVIGQRGGVYKETSDITTANNMPTTLRKSLVRALNELGYKVTDDAVAAGASVTVNITNISYVSSLEKKVLTRIETKVEVQGVINKNNREFTAGYRATRTKDFVKTPNELENEDIVNDALALVLKNMLEDSDFTTFLDG